MDSELEHAPVHGNLDYVINWRGLTIRHLALPIVLTVVLAYFSLWMPVFKLLIPTTLVIALGLGSVAFMIIVQLRKPPEYFDFMLQKFRTPDQLSPFQEIGTEQVLEFAHVDLWTDEEGF